MAVRGGYRDSLDPVGGFVGLSTMLNNISEVEHVSPTGSSYTGGPA